jgi:hypothetical protein
MFYTTADESDATIFKFESGIVAKVVFGFSVGSEVGIHNHFDTRNIIYIYSSMSDYECDSPDTAVGFKCSLDEADGDMDWAVWESEAVDAILREVGCTETAEW